jgi:hypothetical protein
MPAATAFLTSKGNRRCAKRLGAAASRPIRAHEIREDDAQISESRQRDQDGGRLALTVVLGIDVGSFGIPNRVFCEILIIGRGNPVKRPGSQRSCPRYGAFEHSSCFWASRAVAQGDFRKRIAARSGGNGKYDIRAQSV